MNILYIANARIPTEKAHGAQILKTCEALAKAGATVELLVPSRKNPIREDAFTYYKVKKTFRLTTLSVPDTVSWGFFGFVFHSVLFALAARRSIRKHPCDVVYGRDELPLALLRLLGVKKRIVWESHIGAWNVFARYLAHRARLVVISDGLRSFYVEHGIPGERILVAHDGVDLADFENVGAKSSSRAKLGIAEGEALALYVGALTPDKGIDVLGGASEKLSGIVLAAIGGPEPAIGELKKKYPKLRLLGTRPYRELASNLAAGDVLVLPNSGKEEVWARFTSPLKLFAYMASGIPILAADVPALREVLDDDSAYWFTADDGEACARAIERALSDPVEGRKKAARALEKVREYTWDERARRILSYIA